MVQVNCRVFTYDLVGGTRREFEPCDSWVLLAK